MLSGECVTPAAETGHRTILNARRRHESRQPRLRTGLLQDAPTRQPLPAPPAYRVPEKQASLVLQDANLLRTAKQQTHATHDRRRDIILLLEQFDQWLQVPRNDALYVSS